MLLVKLLVAADDEPADPLKLPAKKKIVRNERERAKKKMGGGWVVLGQKERKIFFR
jgi:hypothetical protein